MTPRTPSSDAGDDAKNTNIHNESLEPLFISSGPLSEAHRFPLAQAETPAYLRSFQFNYGGREAIFKEIPLSAEGCLITALPYASDVMADGVPSDVTGANAPPPPTTTTAAVNGGGARPSSLESTTQPTNGSTTVTRTALKRDVSAVSDTNSASCTESHSHVLKRPALDADVSANLPTPVTLSIPAARDNETGVTSPPDEETTNGEPLSLPSPSVSPVTGSRGAKPLAGAAAWSSWAANTPVGEMLRSVHHTINAFDQMPEPVRNYVLYSLLKRCDRRSLSFTSGLISPALRCDLLSVLPAELSYKILGYLDVKTLCNAAQVSKTWNSIVDGAEWIWKDLIEKDELSCTDEDVQKAGREGWGYTGWNRTKTPVNIYKAIYRRKYLIRQNWMNPKSKPKHLAVLGHGNDVVTCLQFDDDQIITGSDDKTINVYDTRTGQLKRRFEGHEGGVWALKYINKNTLISGSTDRTVRVWDIEKAKCTHIFYGHTSTVRCLDTVEPVKRIDPATNQVSYMPPYPIIITGSRDCTLRMWKLPKPDDPPYLPQNASESTYADPYFLRSLRGHTHSVRALSGYEDTVVSGSYDTTVRVWKISTGQCLWELTGHAQRVYSAVLDHKRNRCISGSMDWLVKVWSIETGSLLYTLEGHTSLVGLLDLNRTTLVSAAADSTLRVWDPETGASIHKLEGHQGAITCFQHDENKVVSGSDPILKLWNIRNGKLVRDLLTNLTRIWQVSFDEQRCVAAVKRNEDTYIEILDFDYDPFSEKNEERVIISASDERIRQVTEPSQQASAHANN